MYWPVDTYFVSNVAHEAKRVGHPWSRGSVKITNVLHLSWKNSEVPSVVHTKFWGSTEQKKTDLKELKSTFIYKQLKSYLLY